MAGDRDIGVAFALAWSSRVGPARSGWEVAAATGVRGLRLFHESSAFAEFLLTEANPSAAEVLARNVARYPGASAALGDGREAPARGRYDLVEVDPYGSPAEFLPAAFAAVRPGGVLAVTATDMMVLAGVQKGVCERRYGAVPVRGRLGPEGGLRILLAYLAREARARDRSMRPLLAYARDHHVRAYVEVGPRSVAEPPVGTVDPSSWPGPRLGDRGPYGPLWLGPMFDLELVRSLRVPPGCARPEETAGFLERLSEEVGTDVPFYYESNRLARVLSLASPPSLAALFEGLRSRGYRAARTHARAEGFRSDAPRDVVESVASASSARTGPGRRGP
jgi:tRNA (guanine26-N2/guanine27-N2)-dimethyltransferase